MKKIYTLLSLLMALTVGSLESRAGQVTFRIAEPQAVKISIQDYDSYQTVYPELKEGDNVIEYTDGIDYYISIESTNGWGLESIKAEGDYSDLPVNYNSSYIYINQYAAPVDGNIYTINVYNKEAARTASFEVTVTDEDFNPNLLRVYRGNEYIIICLLYTSPSPRD